MSAMSMSKSHLMTTRTMLIVVGTYSEKLGHVTGKGDGLYVLNVDDETLMISQTEDQDGSTSAATSSSSTFFGKPQLGPSSGPQGMANPTYLIAHESKDTKSVVIYAVDEREDHPGTLRALTLDKETGELSPLGGVEDIIPADDRPNEGGACCHVMVTPDEKYVLAANYLCGSLVVVGRRTDGSLDSNDCHYYRLDGKPVKRADDNGAITYPGPNANRQDRSHAHMVLYSRGTESDSILVPDLGSDCVWSIPYIGAGSDGPLGKPVATGYDPVLAGGGPRHAALHPDPNVRKVYVNYELTSLVACFDIDEKTGAIVSSSSASYSRPTICNVLAGTRSDSFFSGASKDSISEDCKKMYECFLQCSDIEQSGVPTCSDEKTSTAAIRITPDGSHVLVSSRIVNGEGAISALSLQKNGDLNSQISAKIRGVIGKTPRDFIIVEGREETEPPVIIAAAQDTDEIAVLREGKNPVLLTKNAPTPVCLCVVPTL